VTAISIVTMDRDAFRVRRDVHTAVHAWRSYRFENLRGPAHPGILPVRQVRLTAGRPSDSVRTVEVSQGPSTRDGETPPAGRAVIGNFSRHTNGFSRYSQFAGIKGLRVYGFLPVKDKVTGIGITGIRAGRQDFRFLIWRVDRPCHDGTIRGLPVPCGVEIMTAVR